MDPTHCREALFQACRRPFRPVSAPLLRAHGHRPPEDGPAGLEVGNVDQNELACPTEQAGYERCLSTEIEFVMRS